MQFKTKAEVPSRWSTYMHRFLGSSAAQPWVLSYWIRLPEYNIQKKSFFLSLEVFPHRFQPSVSGYSEKECALAHSRAEARLLQQPSTFAPSAHPCGALFCFIGRNFLWNKKENTFMLSFYLFLLFIFLSLILHDIFHPAAQNLTQHLDRMRGHIRVFL